MRLVTHGLRGTGLSGLYDGDKEIENGHLKEVEVSLFERNVLRFHTCLTDILGFLEKFGWWFEHDIGGENEDDNDKKLVMVNEEGRMS
nr:hypothetical protein [Tanacetum cinerariifolium]